MFWGFSRLFQVLPWFVLFSLLTHCEDPEGNLWKISRTHCDNQQLSRKWETVSPCRKRSLAKGAWQQWRRKRQKRHKKWPKDGQNFLLLTFFCTIESMYVYVYMWVCLCVFVAVAHGPREAPRFRKVPHFFEPARESVIFKSEAWFKLTICLV